MSRLSQQQETDMYQEFQSSEKSFKAFLCAYQICIVSVSLCIFGMGIYSHCTVTYKCLETWILIDVNVSQQCINKQNKNLITFCRYSQQKYCTTNQWMVNGGNVWTGNIQTGMHNYYTLTPMPSQQHKQQKIWCNSLQWMVIHWIQLQVCLCILRTGDTSYPSTNYTTIFCIYYNVVQCTNYRLAQVNRTRLLVTWIPLTSLKGLI